jgi:hypothetical protein
MMTIINVTLAVRIGRFAALKRRVGSQGTP